jgi:hypothetical protein
MKRKGKEYFGIPKWFVRQFRMHCNESLLNVKDCRHYIGFGLDGKKHTWGAGVFLHTLELSLPYWRQEAARADFIIHFEEAL